MTGYLTGFMVYTLAMLGVIFIAFVVMKKTFIMDTGRQKNTFLKIESSLSVEPRKNLYVVKAGNERFLVSSGADGCRFMTKLEKGNSPLKIENSRSEINNEIEENVTKIAPKMSIPKMSIPKIEIPALGPSQDYIGLKEILREERVR